MKCYACLSEKCVPFLSFGHQPPSDAFLSAEGLQKPETTYPLDLLFCTSCTLVQLGYAVDPDVLFRNYVYNTGTNKKLVMSFKELVDDAVARYSIKQGDLAIDIGSNDGTLLKNYLPHGIQILGIDPSSVAAQAAKDGIPTMVEYFSLDTAKTARAEHGTSLIITATNVFAHVVQLNSFMEGVDHLLAPNGVFITESGYLMDIVTNMEYDCVYHEHLRYYSLRSLDALFKRFGMEVFRVVRTTGSSGGSIRVFAGRIGEHPVENNVTELRALEDEMRLGNLATYQEFARRVASTKRALLKIISDFKDQGARIVAIGAPAKGNTLLNYCKLDTDLIDYAAENSVLKIGLYTPGMHIPVVDEKRIFEEQPEAALLLAWNYADLLIPKLRELGYKGTFIVPNPIPHTV